MTMAKPARSASGSGGRLGLTLANVVAENVRGRRSELGWTQADLADRARMERTYVSAIERAGKNIGLDTLQRLADALGIHPAELLVDGSRRYEPATIPRMSTQEIADVLEERLAGATLRPFGTNQEKGRATRSIVAGVLEEHAPSREGCDLSLQQVTVKATAGDSFNVRANEFGGASRFVVVRYAPKHPHDGEPYAQPGRVEGVHVFEAAEVMNALTEKGRRRLTEGKPAPVSLRKLTGAGP